MEGWDGGRGGGRGLLYMMDIAGRPLVDQTVTATSKLWYRAAKHLVNLGFVDMILIGNGEATGSAHTSRQNA